MSKLSLKILLGVFGLMFSSSVGLSSECEDDPNECTPKNLCLVATQVINDNKVWSEDASAAKHIIFAKELGMECGVVEITEPCDLDPNECKVKQLCEKATIGGEGSKSWNTEAEAYVKLAKEYGLECRVDAAHKTEKVSTISPAEKLYKCKMDPIFCSDEDLCSVATSTNLDGKLYFNSAYEVHVSKAKERGLTCGVSEGNEAFARYFKSKEPVLRKKIQYALKELGYYSKKIDGLWGEGTLIAFENFVSSWWRFEAAYERQNFAGIIENLIAKVDNYPDFSKSNYSTSSSSKYSKAKSEGWVPLSGEPKLPYDDAKEICEAKAIAEGNSYINSNRPRNRSSSINCYGYGFDSYSCRRSSGGGWAAGALKALEESRNRNAGKELAQAVAKACMADYGWRYIK